MNLMEISNYAVEEACRPQLLKRRWGWWRLRTKAWQYFFNLKSLASLRESMQGSKLQETQEGKKKQQYFKEMRVNSEADCKMKKFLFKQFSLFFLERWVHRVEVRLVDPPNCLYNWIVQGGFCHWLQGHSSGWNNGDLNLWLQVLKDFIWHWPVCLHWLPVWRGWGRKEAKGGIDVHGISN